MQNQITTLEQTHPITTTTPRTYYNCGKPGHFASNYPTKDKDQTLEVQEVEGKEDIENELETKLGKEDP